MSAPHDVARAEDVRALAQRLGNLADELHEAVTKLEVMSERALHRDAQLVDLKRDSIELLADMKVVKAKKIEAQLTENEIKVLKEIMLGKDRADWLKQRSKYYFYGTLGLATTIFMLRDWIKAGLVKLGIVS